MKKNKLAEIRTKSLPELQKEQDLLTKKLIKTGLEIVSGKTKNLRSGKNLRKDMAQIQTIMEEKND